jgi:hypothetical protein
MRMKKLEKIYYDPSDPAGYAGASKLKSRIPHEDVTKWLHTQPAYSLHKPMLRRFPTRKYKTSGINELWQMDLLEMIPYSTINNDYKYILTCIDVYSRFARALPLKSKNGTDVSQAIAKILQEGISPRYIQTDLGKEFYNKQVQQVFSIHGIKHYSVNSQFKAALVERLNRTLRERLNRFFTHKNKKIWINVLDKIVHAYNISPHRGIGGKKPIDVSNNFNLWETQESKKVSITPKKLYKIDDLVRISRISASPFRKNFDQNWSEEVFRIAAIDTREKPVMYVLKDLGDEIIQGKFYQQELQHIGNVLPNVYRIEQVIRTRGTGKHKQYLVKWYGYDKRHNSWISQDQFINAE